MDLDQSGAGAETISSVHISQSWIFFPLPLVSLFQAEAVLFIIGPARAKASIRNLF